MKEITIRDVFNKERDPLRALNEVVKVADDSKKNQWIEFEEFVITESLLKYITEFHEDFTASIHLEGPKKPFWLEGFYGSGKSHFSKIIGLLFQNTYLENTEGVEWSAISFFSEKLLNEVNFKDDSLNDIKDQLKNSLNLFLKQYKCETIFINLSKYSKSEKQPDDIMESFMLALLKEYNLKIGLAESIEIAEIEKNLIKEGIYEEFKVIVNEQVEEEWEQIRKTGPWARRAFISAYKKITDCSDIEAQSYIDGAISDCEQKNIEKVLNEMNQWIKENLDKTEEHIAGKMLIVLDEAGLFFSSKASRIGEMMAAAEWINNPVKESRINMIFNAQQSIKQYFESVKTSIDYRTAEQRFKRWFLDKNNIKTIVVKRWLNKDKTDSGNKLIELIDNKYPNIIDGAIFDTIKDPNLEYVRPSREEIVETYPFLPFQFPLMIQITQSLISEKIVEEQYGGKTRSILSITRDVLANPISEKESHFVDEKLGYFVILPQIYDSIVLTLKKKNEDQFLLVENSKKITEDNTIFTVQEQELNFSFYEVMKIILLLKYIDEVYSYDQNIAKGLLYEISCDKKLILEKVKKLINVLKQKGYISYNKREFEGENGTKKEFWEYKIASEEERKYIEKTHHVVITDDAIEKRLEFFFKESMGNEIIKFKDHNFINKLSDPSNNEYSLSNGVKLKLNWEIDSQLESIEAKISDPNFDSVNLSIITLRKVYKWREDLDGLKKKLQLLTIKALNNNKIFLFITPSFTQSRNQIQENYNYLNSSLKDCIRIDKTIKDDPNIPGNIRLAFIQRIQDIEKDILKLFKEQFDEGSIVYGKQDIIRISKDNINVKINDVLKELFSKINKYAYLGQIKPSSSQITSILTWDPKTKTNIPKILRKNENTAEAIFIFNKDGTDLQPNLAEQTHHIIREFNKILTSDDRADFVAGSNLFETFQNPPYSWTVQTILTVIAALIRNNDWDVYKGNLAYEPEHKDIINSFNSTKNNYEKFRMLLFRKAERLTMEEMNNAKDFLERAFNVKISKVGPDQLNNTIMEVAKEITDKFSDVKEDISKLELDGNFKSEIEKISNKFEEIVNTQRPVDRIRQLLEQKAKLSTKQLYEEFLNCKKILYRISELKENNEVVRYYHLDEFHSKIMNDWLSTHEEIENINDLKDIKKDVSKKLHDPKYLFEDQWKELWDIEKELWDIYWEKYIEIHNSLKKEIEKKIEDLKKHPKSGNLTEEDQKSLKDLFLCDFNVKKPEKIKDNNFTCEKCNMNHSSLRLRAIDIEKKYIALKEKLETEREVEVITDKDKENKILGKIDGTTATKEKDQKMKNIIELLSVKIKTLKPLLLEYIELLLHKPPNEDNLKRLIEDNKSN